MFTRIPRSFLCVLPPILCVLAMGACAPSPAERARAMLASGPDLPRIRELVKENVETHLEGAHKVAGRLAPLFAGETPPSEASLRETLAGVTKPPHVIQALVFSPVDLMVVLDPEGVVTARDREVEGKTFRGRNLFEESPELRAAFEKGGVATVLGKLGRGDHAVPYLYFIAPIEREGKTVAAAVLGYALWKEGRRITFQMRRETEQGEERVLVVWALAYLGDALLQIPNVPFELKEILPDAGARREALEANPGGSISTVRILRRELGVAILPMPELGEDFGFVYVRGLP